MHTGHEDTSGVAGGDAERVVRHARVAPAVGDCDSLDCERAALRAARAARAGLAIGALGDP